MSSADDHIPFRAAPAAVAAAILFWAVSTIRADEQLWGFVRGAETLPAKRAEFYQFFVLHEGKAEGTYYGSDFESEFEYGFIDRFQASIAVEQHYFYNKGVDGDRDALNDTDAYRFGGVKVSGKYRLLSPFKDPIGLALRLESGYLWNDEVDGLPQSEFFLKPEIDFQKDFRDDTIILAFDLAADGPGGNSRRRNIQESFPTKSHSRAPTVSRRTGSSVWRATCARSIRSSIFISSSTA